MSSEDQEEDYMSDSLLAGTTDVRPGLLLNHSQKRKHELFKKKEIGKKTKSIAETEKSTREMGLETPISESNKGYQMLMKMGFKPGDKIGTGGVTSSGLKEPIKIVVKDLKTGIGHESQIAEKQEKILEQRKKKNRKLLEEFRMKTMQKKNEKLILSDYKKVQRLCEDLDSRNSITNPTADWFWPERKPPKKEEDDSDEKESSDTEKETVLNINEVFKNLQSILTYLRNTYSYCMYCAISYENEGDLEQNCPGLSRDVHSDD